MRTNVKVNLGLNVLRRRPDGFHDIETLFVPYYGFGDDLEIVPASDFDIEIDNCGWDPQEDLTARAYRLLRDEFGLPPVSIRLFKGAPVGAGLGGGSADAAFALRRLNDIFSLALSDDELAARAAKLGSDCAFFIYNRPMIGTGRGEVLEPFDLDLSGYEMRVEIPEGVSVSTAEAYRGVLAARERAIADGSLRPVPLRETLALPVERWKDVLVNDFEATVFPLHPEIAALKQRFYARGAVYAAMSGSGSAVFGLFRK
jgi:4-diphosphocytidyl-2-C-methyl-D-erythritol kinase